jgi:mono/diheme cytochrome c family protein
VLLTGLPVLLLGAGVPRAEAPPLPADQKAYDSRIRPLLTRYCGQCHGETNPSGDLNLASFKDLASIRKEDVRWQRVRARLQAKTMPPSGLPQPTDDERTTLTAWISAVLPAPTPTSATPVKRDPGRVLIHRLNRTEYNNTIRDLVGIDTHPADSFPADGGGGGGFDNDADTLFVPPILMERYISAATELLAQAPRTRLFGAARVKNREGARTAIARFTPLAYRRPVAAPEIDGLMSLYDRAIKRGKSPEEAARFALKAVLISPSFLFRVEADRGVAGFYAISDYELASRLSYFFWSSMPDETLFHLAAQNRLHTPAVLAEQVRRMVASPKAQAFADNFAGQWLRVRDLYTSAQPDPNKFKDFTPALRDAMYHETIDFFADVMRSNASLLDMLDCDYTFLNEDLAKYYGVPGITGPQMRRVTLSDRRWGGVLTMASVLTLTSFPQRTSPVLRGKWVLGEILGTPSPPPPPGAGGLSTDDAPDKGLTFRQRLEQHRKRPECVGCHSRMDPIGFGLENFDAIGRWRNDIGGVAVDSSGVLPTGEKFSGPVELKRILLARKDEFIHNVTSEMLAYALGRGLEAYDEPTVAQIAASVAQHGYKSQVLLTEIVNSLPFRYRRGSAGQLAQNTNRPTPAGER